MLPVWKKQKIEFDFRSKLPIILYRRLTEFILIYTRTHRNNETKRRKKKQKQEWMWIILPMNAVRDTNMDNITRICVLDQSDHFECSFDSGQCEQSSRTTLWSKYCVRAYVRARMYVCMCVSVLWVNLRFDEEARKKKGNSQRHTRIYTNTYTRKTETETSTNNQTKKNSLNLLYKWMNTQQLWKNQGIPKHFIYYLFFSFFFPLPFL